MRIHARIALSAVLLAACGASETDPANQTSADSAVVEAISEDPTTPATPAEQGVVGNVNQRLDQAEKDAAARSAEGMEQVRQAEEGAQSP